MPGNRDFEYLTNLLNEYVAVVTVSCYTHIATIFGKRAEQANCPLHQNYIFV